MKNYRFVCTIRGPSEETEEKYLAEIPALPGCRAWGDTRAEAPRAHSQCGSRIPRIVRGEWGRASSILPSLSIDRIEENSPSGNSHKEKGAGTSPGSSQFEERVCARWRLGLRGSCDHLVRWVVDSGLWQRLLQVAKEGRQDTAVLCAPVNVECGHRADVGVASLCACDVLGLRRSPGRGS